MPALVLLRLRGVGEFRQFPASLPDPQLLRDAFELEKFSGLDGSNQFAASLAILASFWAMTADPFMRFSASAQSR